MFSGSKQLRIGKSGWHLITVVQRPIIHEHDEAHRISAAASNTGTEGKAAPLCVQEQLLLVPPAHTAPDTSELDWPDQPSPHSQTDSLRNRMTKWSSVTPRDKQYPKNETCMMGSSSMKLNIDMGPKTLFEVHCPMTLWQEMWKRVLRPVSTFSLNTGLQVWY